MQNVVKLLIGVAVCTMLLTGCSIQMQQPTVKNYKRVLAMDELRPITVEQLRQIIASDTTHYKVVVITSACCYYCSLAMRDTYPTKMAECDSSLVRWIFVEYDYSTAQYMDEAFTKYHIDGPRYWINDTLPQYRTLMAKSLFEIVRNTFKYWGQDFSAAGYDIADNRMGNIVNAIAPQQELLSAIDGTPTTLLLNPKNHMKCTRYIDAGGTATLMPTEIQDIHVPVTALDFKTIDTITSTPQVCTPEGCN